MVIVFGFSYAAGYLSVVSMPCGCKIPMFCHLCKIFVLKNQRLDPWDVGSCAHGVVLGMM